MDDGGKPLSEARERARKIRPQYAEGPLVRVATARNQAEAELLESLLLEEGIPSLVRRRAASTSPTSWRRPRELLVPAAGAEVARELLGTPGAGAGLGRGGVAGVGEGARGRAGGRHRGGDRRRRVRRRLPVTGRASAVRRCSRAASCSRSRSRRSCGRRCCPRSGATWGSRGRRGDDHVAFALGRLVTSAAAARRPAPPGRALAGSGVGVAVSAVLLATAQSLTPALAGVFFLGSRRR